MVLKQCNLKISEQGIGELKIAQHVCLKTTVCLPSKNDMS